MTGGQQRHDEPGHGLHDPHPVPPFRGLLQVRTATMHRGDDEAMTSH